MMETSRGFFAPISWVSIERNSSFTFSLTSFLRIPGDTGPWFSFTDAQKSAKSCVPSQHQTDTRFLPTKRQIQKTERESSSEWVRRFTPLLKNSIRNRRIKIIWYFKSCINHHILKGSYLLRLEGWCRHGDSRDSCLSYLSVSWAVQRVTWGQFECTGPHEGCRDRLFLYKQLTDSHTHT